MEQYCQNNKMETKELKAEFLKINPNRQNR